MSFEHIIFSNLLFREDYGRKVIPFLKKEYFQDNSDKIIFDLVESYVEKYNNFPSVEALLVDLSNKDGVDGSVYENTVKTIKAFELDTSSDLEWLIDKTEKYCQERAVYNAIMNSIKILDGKDTKNNKGAIPQLLSDALSVSFDDHIGHSYIEDSDQRYEFYHRVESKIPYNLEYFNKITNGGLPRKTLNIILAGTGVGKSLFMCHQAAGNLMDGKNVLYITLEMAEERIAERIDANLLDITLDDLKNMSKDEYMRKLERLKNKTAGRLIIKEYPTSTAGSSNFRYLLNELKIKKNFKPDIVYVDYLNICASSRLKYTSNVNTYMYVKAIAEELRGLAVEFDIPIISATQTTRSGYSASDVGLEDTSESFGLPATADFMFALISNEELQSLNQILVKQLKNRYNDLSVNRRFVIGVNRKKMKLYDVEESAQKDLVDDTPIMDKGSYGDREKATRKIKSMNFDDFK